MSGTKVTYVRIVQKGKCTLKIDEVMNKRCAYMLPVENAGSLISEKEKGELFLNGKSVTIHLTVDAFDNAELKFEQDGSYIEKKKFNL